MAVLEGDVLARVLQRSGPKLAVLLVLLLYFAGCFMAGAVVEEERQLAFSHRLHVEDEGLECSDCHARWEDAEDPGMPRAAQCALCHSELDSEKPPDLRVETLFDDGEFRAAHAGQQSDEIMFSHVSHAGRLECNACHAEVARDGPWIELAIGDHVVRAASARSARGTWVSVGGRAFLFEPVHRHAAAGGETEDSGEVRAPMTGRVAAVEARAGADVREGDLLLTVEAMKMEFKVAAPASGRVEDVACAAGDRVELGQVLVRIRAAAEAGP